MALTIQLQAEQRQGVLAVLAAEHRTAARRFDIPLEGSYNYLRDMNGNLVLDVNGLPIIVF